MWVAHSGFIFYSLELLIQSLVYKRLLNLNVGEFLGDLFSTLQV